MAAIIGWMRSLKQLPDAVAGTTQWGPLGRIGLALDKIPFEADLVPAVVSPAATRPTDIGEYAFRTDCSHCHNLDTAKQSEAFLALKRLSPWRNPIQLPISRRCCAPARASAAGISA